MQIIYYMQICIYYLDIVVGLERTFYQVLEDMGVVEVCAIVHLPDNTVPCPITFTFNVSLSTSNITAGIINYYIYFNCIHCV